MIAWRQCPKRLWLEVHQPELRADSSSTAASFAAGHEVGDVARRIYDPQDLGTTLDPGEIGIGGVLARTQELLAQRRPIFEAGFSVKEGERGALSLADVLLPEPDGSWHMVEVKSSTQVKDYHVEDAAIQFHIATRAGLRVSRVSVAHIDSKWVYPGGADRRGLLKEVDVSGRVGTLQAEVPRWIASAHDVVDGDEPAQRMGGHCGAPFDCGFRGHCEQQLVAAEGTVEFPVHWLPGIRSEALKEHIAQNGVRSMEDVPDALLSERQLRVKRQMLEGQVFFDREGAASALAAHPLPALFLDFETIGFAVPRWAGTRPYQQIPFQFSLHRLDAAGALTHSGFLDLTGTDPSHALARALVDACEAPGPIFAYNKGFERGRIAELAERFAELRLPLLRIANRLVDLLPVAKEHYYHPEQQGSWSIKRVLPAMVPDLRYDDLAGVRDGGEAQQAYIEAIASQTSATRRNQLRDQLSRYCELDTFAMVRIWQQFHPDTNEP
nr:DUF2779 domain-containing protein [Ramlibacter agri]